MRSKALVSESASPIRAPSWWSAARIPVLVVGDALSFLAFASAGLNSHQETSASALATLATAAGVAIPFALGWFLVGPFAGAFRRSRTNTWKKMLARTELAWLCAYPVSLILRVLIAPDHQMPLTFAVIILISNALFLGIWRSLFALAEQLLTRPRHA